MATTIEAHESTSFDHLEGQDKSTSVRSSPVRFLMVCAVWLVKGPGVAVLALEAPQ